MNELCRQSKPCPRPGESHAVIVLDIPIWMVMPQTEFNSAQIFPSCTWTPEGLAKFIAHLGPQMRDRDVEIYLGTIERADDGLVHTALADPSVAGFVSGLGVQWHSRGAVPYLHRDYPALPLYQTEQECGDGKNDWRFCRYAWTLMKHYFENGASAYFYWNLSLDRGGVSRWGWEQNSLVVVDPDTADFVYTHEYYLLKHVSHFVQPGAHVLPAISYSGFENQLAFRNPDGSIDRSIVVVVIQNDTNADQQVNIMIGDQFLTPTLVADSFNTIVLPA